MKQFIKKFLKVILGEYSIYHIYTRMIDNCREPPSQDQDFYFTAIERSDVESSNERLISEQAGYHGQGSFAYACMHNDQIVGLCYLWYGERYRKRNFWPLADGEAKLVQIITLPSMRGHGVAKGLLCHAAYDMSLKGFTRLYARIWHSNTPSSRAFQRAGWQRLAIVIEISPLRRATPLRMTIRSRV